MWERICRCLFVTAPLVLAVALSARGQTGADARAPALRQDSPANQVQASTFFLPRLPVSPSYPVLPRGTGFPQMVRAAGIIFSGRVISISSDPPSDGAAIAGITITFHVDRALRGAITGKNLAIRQWTGLWSGGQRYYPGERVLVFLYPPSKLGLTSTVSGPLGRFAFDPRGRVLLSEQHRDALRADLVLGGKSRISLDDFARAVRGAGGEERSQP